MFIQAALVLVQIVISQKSWLKGARHLHVRVHMYQPPFYCNFNFTCLVSAHVNIKRIPGYKETVPAVQFVDDNQVSFPALIYMYMYLHTR